MPKKTKTRVLLSLLLVFSILATLVSCFPIGSKNTVTAHLQTSDLPEFDVNIFYTVEMCFKEYYYTSLEDPEVLAEKTLNAYYEFCADDIDANDKDAVTHAIIDCYIYAVGDNYAFYRTADELEDYTGDMSGKFVGIGVSVMLNRLENTILVIGVEMGSPASKAGITADDYIIAVDGVSISELGVEVAIDNIKGVVGSEVEVTVLRGTEELTFKMERAEITETTVSHEMLEDGKIGYIKITGFKGNTASQFKMAVDTVLKAGAESVIFDVRSNPGGYLDAVTTMLSYLVPTGTAIASFSDDFLPPVFAEHGTVLEPKDHFLTIPSVVLCNGDSASASELFAGAMRDYNKMGILDATVMGEVTYKKGIMQSTIDFTNGSALTLTVALYNPPSKENFHGVGVTPDIILSENDDYIAKALEVLGGK